MIEHPYKTLTGGAWLRGNLHAHTTRSDGVLSPQAVIDKYAGLGYDFLAISDHDIFTSAEDHARLDTRGLTLLPANEITADGPHVLHIGGQSRVARMDRREVLRSIGVDGGFAIVNHPNWHADFNHCSIETLRSWDGYLGLEIYNGVIGRLEGSPYATNKWDMLLTDGRPVWGFANDDSHDPTAGDYGQGWNVLYAMERTPEAILEALTRGRFYASTGVVIEEILVEEDRITLRTANAARVVALSDAGKRFAMADRAAIEVTVPEGARYVRFECWGVGESFAWTQPFRLRRE
jgi:hypothetical protein